MQKLYVYFFLLLSCPIFAQSPTDGIMMPKGQLCVLGQYSHSAWKNYWQGETKRANANLGTVSTQSALLMANYGVSGKLNAMIGLPYVWTNASASRIAGLKGIQDLSVFLKYQAFQKTLPSGRFLVQFTGGVSSPVSNYTGDFLPFSIGLHSKTASLRGILNFTSNIGLYVTAQAGHSWRGKSISDRDSYIFENALIYSNEMPVPNLLDYGLRLGWIKSRFQTEIWVDGFAGLSGDDIRYNEAPQPTNKMLATQVGGFGKYFITKRLGVLASLSQVIHGRNVGQAFTWTVGTTYFLDIQNRKTSGK